MFKYIFRCFIQKEKSDKKVTGEELMKAACLYTLEIRLNDHYPGLFD